MIHPADPGGGTNDTSLGPGHAQVRRGMFETTGVEDTNCHALERVQDGMAQGHLSSTPKRWDVHGCKHETG